jgi:prepilin-type N-terminal cleavage/methylation domain-containing protein/prepilin-type processing-associated H-X9-DG protein
MLRIHSRRRSGFTLIELLVSISVIVVLLAILIPALGRARNRVRILGCLSNQRQITVAMTAYAQSNPRQFYHADAGLGGTDDLSYLYRLAYLEAYILAVCPDTSNVVDVPIGNHYDLATQQFVYGEDYHDLLVPAAHAHDESGGHSYELFHVASPGQFPNGVALNEPVDMNLTLVGTVLDPTETFICLDSDNDPVNGGLNIDGLFGFNNLPDAETNNHRDQGGNVGFLDGSARFIPRSEWVRTMITSTHVGAMNLQRAQEIDPGYRRSPRSDGGLEGLRHWFVD